jgi:hypothetical protein
MNYSIISIVLTVIATAGLPALAGSKIDREALVARHAIVITNADPLTPVSVGNGEFAFTADITGLQTFPRFYVSANPKPLSRRC